MKNSLIWIIALVLTIGTAYYQRKTGPTYPKKVSFGIDRKTYTFDLPRSHTGNSDMPLVLNIPDTSVQGYVVFKRYPTSEPWDTVKFMRQGNNLTVSLPHQPPAGKLAYLLILDNGKENITVPEEGPVIVRSKGSVSALILVPHIFIMFLAMLLSTLTGLMAIWKKPRYKTYAWLTLIFLSLGGFLFGPLVQLSAFGAYWTGIPFGWDLTDNKILIAILFWLFACLAILKKDRYWTVILAAVVLLLIYSVPHSLYGSQYNYQTGDIVQGYLLWSVAGLMHKPVLSIRDTERGSDDNERRMRMTVSEVNKSHVRRK